MARKPDPEVDLRIKRAATTLIFTKGLDFTMDDVAQAAAVGRASVFRRYTGKRELLLDALASAMDTQGAVPDTGPFAGDLRGVVAETLAGAAGVGRRWVLARGRGGRRGTGGPARGRPAGVAAIQNPCAGGRPIQRSHG